MARGQVADQGISKLNLFMAFVVLILVGAVFQNCSDHVNFQSIPSKVDISGGGQCVTGEKLGIWLDPDGTGKALDANFLGYVVAYVGNETPAANYNYFSYSAHPQHGPIPVDNRLNVFFYQQAGKDQVALNVFSNIDEFGGDGSFVTQMTTTNNSQIDTILLQDDPNEADGCSRQPGLHSSLEYYCKFKYNNNTDGFVLGPFVSSNYEIRVSIPKISNINQARFFSANGSNFTLKDEYSGISSFIIKSVGYESCN